MIPLYKPFIPELPELDDIIHSGAIAYGTYTKQFEDGLKKYFDSPYVIVTNSFTSAISVAITSLGLNFGDEVIASPMACLASTQPYLSCGMKVRWCDVDAKTGTLSPKSLRKTITSRTKAIIHNHFCGYPGYIDEINAIAKEFDIPVIDDGIECLGSEYKGKKIGNVGTDVTVFSLSYVRMLSCIEGGLVIFKNKDLYEKSLRIRDCGIDRTKFRDDIGEISSNCDISEIGFSATMSNVNGYIGLQQLKYVNDLINKQRTNALKLKEILKNDDAEPLYAYDSNPNYWVYGILVKNKREAIKKYRDLGLFASGVHINNNIYSVFGDRKNLPGVDEFYNHFIALPSGWWIDNYLEIEGSL